MVFGKGETCCAEFLCDGFWNIFASSTTHSCAVVKWMLSQDSARQIGPESTSINFLMVGSSGCTEGEKLVGGILKIGILELWLVTMSQPATLWQNGWYHWIQLVKLV